MGVSVDNRSLLVLKSIAQPRAGALSVLLLMGVSSSAASAQDANPAAQTPSYCVQVKNPDARNNCELSRSQFYAGNVRAALATIRKAAAASPKEGVLNGMAARIMLRLGDFSAAEHELREARKKGAPDHFVLPVLFGAMVQQHEEINLLNEFPDPAPGAKGETVADILQGRALALQSLDKLPEAAAATDRALSMRRDPDILLFRAKLAEDQNNQAMADKFVEEARKLDPNNVQVLMAKVHQYERTGNDAGVLSTCDQVLKILPNFTNARVAKIKIFLKRNEDAKAKTEVQYFLSRSAKSPFGLYYNAVLMSRAKNKKGAAEAIQSLPPDFVRAHPENGMQIAQILFDNGNVETGAAVLASSLSAKPDLLDARLRLAELRMSQNSPQSALGLLTPVKDSKDPRVQKLLGAVQAKIAKDRSF